MEEATTDANVEERPAQADSDTNALETADTQNEEAGRTEEAPDKFSFIEDEALRSKVNEVLDSTSKSWKGKFDKETQDHTTKLGALEQQAQQSKTQYDTLEQQVREVLANPEKFESYRSIYSDQMGVASKVDPTQFETMDQLVGYLKTEISAAEQKATSSADARVTREMANMRWKSALDIKRADPDFARMEKLVVNLAATDKRFTGMHSAGSSEGEILDAAMAAVKELIEPNLAQARQEAKTAKDAKIQAASKLPSNAIAQTTNASTEDNKPLFDLSQHPNLINEIIARVDSKYPSKR